MFLCHRQKLNYKQLKNICSPSDFSFQTTEEISSLDGGVIGQERAVKAFDFGLTVKMQGYNIFMTGPSGTGKTTYAKSVPKKLQQRNLCLMIGVMYIIFQNPRTPLALRF